MLNVSCCQSFLGFLINLFIFYKKDKIKCIHAFKLVEEATPSQNIYIKKKVKVKSMASQSSPKEEDENLP